MLETAAPPGRSRSPRVNEAIRATVKGFRGTDRSQLIMVCGTGKTLAAMWIAERLELGFGLAKVGTFLALACIYRPGRFGATSQGG